MEKLMKEDVQAFTKMMMSLMNQQRVKILSIPIEHISAFLEGMKIYPENPISNEMEIIRAYKKENLYELSPKELRHNRMFLEGMYRKLVDKNPDKE